MLHFIGHVGRRDTEFFIRKHVFPGGWIPSLADAIVEMERSGLEVIDVENLRRHYALTLDAWARAIRRRTGPTIQALDPARFNERFRRIWLRYLVGCAEMFRCAEPARRICSRSLFSKGNVSRDSYPMSREHPVWIGRLATTRAGWRSRRRSCVRQGRAKAPSRCASAPPTSFAIAATTPGAASTCRA